MARFIFITGGVVSSLGKGIAAASLAALLQARDYKVRLRKLDPYLNVDPGTMSPYQHGEVFVTDDGAETDLDLGHYERFTCVDATKDDAVTSGRIYQNVIQKERRGDYLGGTVQVIPHVTDMIKNHILTGQEDVDFIICEIGGTVGDIESLPFLEAIRQFGQERERGQVMFIHLTLLPYIPSAGELKTKPTQHSVKELRSIGIQPDLLLCRSDRPIPAEERRKIALFCNVRPSAVIEARDVKTIYEVPLAYRDQGFDTEVLDFFGLNNIKNKAIDLSRWINLVETLQNPQDAVKIVIVGKYTGLIDAYKSLQEALIHGGIANKLQVNLKWIDSTILSEGDVIAHLKDADAILVPGGFGERGAEGKIQAIKYARENNIPYFGICFGMQMAVIETARHLTGLKNATSSEFSIVNNADETHIVGLMTEWLDGAMLEKRKQNGELGGTMRLGSFEAKLEKGSLAHKIYGTDTIKERHRHRYEVNLKYRDMLEKVGMVFTGLSPDGVLPEIVEHKNHAWFVAVQYHPELKSRPFEPHPLFVSFVKAAYDYKNSKGIQ